MVNDPKNSNKIQLYETGVDENKDRRHDCL